MKTIKTIVAIIFAVFVTTGCEKDPPGFNMGLSDGINELNPYLTGELKARGLSAPKATGSVEFIWKGGEKGGEMGNKPENLLAFFEFVAQEPTATQPAKGEIIYTVTKMDTTLHREIRAEVFDVLVDNVGNKAWFIGRVVSDTKGCGGNGSGGHETGCSDSGHTDEGGCGDDTSHDGGCSHDETDEGGCGDDTTHDEGGCGDDTTHDEGGCSGDTSDEGHTGGMGGEPGGSGAPGGADKGNPLSGKNCRIGQLIVVKVHDVSTPGADGDGLTWKWFSPDGSFVPATDNIPYWPHLCKKTIIAGNLVIH